jgi:protocatechuate 3,4-dioxygenase beta subunit
LKKVSRAKPQRRKALPRFEGFLCAFAFAFALCVKMFAQTQIRVIIAPSIERRKPSMVSSARQAIACILLIFSTALYARPQSPAEKGPTSTITGKITVKGKGVPGVAVSLGLIETSNSSTTRHRGVTDDEGNYRITNVLPGSYQVMIAAPAFASVDRLGTQKTIIVNKGEAVENIDFAFVRGGVITGRVTDSEGRPLIEEDVYVVPADREERHLYFGMANGRTDDRGIYRIFGLHPGRYRVAAGQDEEGGFGGMRGRVQYKRTFHPDTAEPSEATVIELKEGDEVANVDITVPVGRTISKYSASGRIVDGETGRPMADVPYGVQMFISPNSSSSMSNGAVSNREGEFKLTSLAPGKYAVFVESGPNREWRADPVHFEVTDQNVTGLIIKTTNGASASGLVVLEGTNDKAIYEKLIKGRLYGQVMNDTPDRGSSPSTSINPDGSFRLSGLQAGVLGFGFPDSRLRIVRIERDGVAYPQGVEIKESEQLTGLRLIFNYGNGTIRGVVKLEKGPPNGQFNISLRRLGENEGGPFISNHNEPPQVDARGQFVAEGLLPGTYEVSAAYAPEMRTPWRRTTQQVVVNNGTVTNVTLTIDPDAPVPSRP